jgi:hypothetical protein
MTTKISRSCQSMTILGAYQTWGPSFREDLDPLMSGLQAADNPRVQPCPSLRPTPSLRMSQTQVSSTKMRVSPPQFRHQQHDAGHPSGESSICDHRTVHLLADANTIVQIFICESAAHRRPVPQGSKSAPRCWVPVQCREIQFSPHAYGSACQDSFLCVDW